MLHILCHQGNANYNNSEIPLHTYQNARGPELQRQMLMKMQDNKTPIHCL